MRIHGGLQIASVEFELSLQEKHCNSTHRKSLCCHSVTMSLSHSIYVILSLCHSVTLSLCHYVTQSLYIYVTLSFCHSATLSLCHYVTLLSMSICHSMLINLVICTIYGTYGICAGVMYGY